MWFFSKFVGSSSLISQPNFNNWSTFSEDLAAFHMGRPEVHYFEIIYLEFCILNLSK